MADFHQHKINAAKFDYEYMGKTPAQVAELYNFPLVCVQEEIRDRGWEVKIEPESLPKTRDMQQFADQLEKITRSKLSIISLFRQIDNQSLYAQLESAILAKCLDTVNGLDVMDDKITNKLVNITKTLTSIQERNPIQLADQMKELASKNPGVIVNIANQIQ